MVDEKPSVRIESTLNTPHQDTETADKLRESIATRPPTLQSTSSDKTNQGHSTPEASVSANVADVLALTKNHPAADSGNKSQASSNDSVQSRMASATTSADDSFKGFLEKQVEGSAAARRVVAYGEGLTGYAAIGAVKAVAHDATHPVELLEKGLVAGTIGVGMKALLPKTGAGKAIVATVMGYYMVKDAVRPLINGWEEAGNAKNMAEVDKAAQHIGTGVGTFAWDAYFGSKVGLKAEKWTGAAMEGAMGSARYANFERAKVDLDKTLLGKPLDYLLSPVAKATSWAADRMVRKTDEPQIQFHEVKHKFAEVEAQNIAEIKNVDLHMKGIAGADGQRLGFSTTLDLLQAGHDPRTVSATEAKSILGTDKGAPQTQAVDPVQVSNEAAAGGSAKIVAGATTDGRPYVKAIVGPTEEIPFKGGNTEGTGSGKTPGNDQIPSRDAAKPPATGGGDGGNGKGNSGGGDGGDGGNGKGPKGDADAGKPVGPNGKPYVTKAEQEVNAVVYGKLAGMNKSTMDAWSDKRVLIADATERLAGPVHAAITPEYTKMDAGYVLARNQMMQIAGQIKSEEDLKYVMPLFSRFSMAATQHISDGLSETAALKYQLDLKALETHSELVRNMKKAGIDPDVVLQSKNPAVFSISHDGGAGPHTMRQIDGVWNVDHVLYPRNMFETRSTTTSGIYGHELGHDQYGGIAKLDESVREQVIGDAIKNGLGARANDKINVPGVGDVSKKDLIEAIFKAQADENTADIWGAAWTGHNSGGALGILLQSLRKGGQLETRNVFGTEYKSADNPYGFEVHAFDALRPKIVASVMRARANGDAKVLEYANALDRYSDEASKPGDYVFANMDTPGQTITIPRRDMEDVIPHLIDAQLNTKLSALQGKSMADILPDLPANMAKMDILADLMVDAIQKGKKPSEIPFDVSQYKMIQVFGAGLPAASRLVAAGMDATEANTQVNIMSDYLRGQYHANDPHVDPLRPSALQTIRLNSPKSLITGTYQGARDAVHGTGQILSRAPQLGDWLASRATPFAAATGFVGVDQNYRKSVTARTMQDLAEIEMTKRAMLDGQNKGQAADQTRGQ